MKAHRATSLPSALALVTLFLAGCTAMVLPTKPEDLANNAYPSQVATLATDPVTAYANLKQMYERCLYKPHSYVSFQLDRANGRASVTNTTDHGAIVSMTTLDKNATGATTLTYIRAKSKVAIREVSPSQLKELLDRDVAWAIGQNKSCE